MGIKKTSLLSANAKLLASRFVAYPATGRLYFRSRLKLMIYCIEISYRDFLTYFNQ